MMDFFAQQDLARRKTKWLIIYFTLAVISMIAMIYGIAIFVTVYLNSGGHHHYYAEQPQVKTWDPVLLAEVAIGTIVVIFFGSAYKTAALSGGGGAVAESLGGRLLASNTTDPNERKLLNVVEEMSIASGVPMPQVYVLEDEESINAFAAGHSTSDAAVTVTRGCMAKLNRDELQGVIGHEFSHILNGDMRLNIRLMGILFGIFCIATIGRILLYTRGNSRDKNPLPIIGILLLIVGSMGLFFGRLIQAAVSRQREFLADASSVQFTRNPGGLSHALQKLGGYGSRVSSPHASDASHLFFGNALTESFFEPMATHPPLEQRIKAIDPNWDGKFIQLDEDRVEQSYERPIAKAKSPPIFNNAMAGVLIASGGVPPVIKANSVLPNLGNPTPSHLKYAEQLRDSLPDSLKAAAREPQGAVALIYALLLSGDESLRAKQLSGLAGRTTQEISASATALYPEVSQAASHARLPLVNITLPALRQMDAAQYNQFSQTLQWLINSDNEVDLFEFVLQKIVLRHLAPKFGQVRPPVIQFYDIKPLLPDCAVVLSALADVGSSDRTEVQKAFAAGAPYLRAPENTGVALLSIEACGINEVDTALNRLTLGAPILKKNLLEACARVVAADGVIQEEEAELLRAIADTLDCPIPPFIPTAQSTS